MITADSSTGTRAATDLETWLEQWSLAGSGRESIAGTILAIARSGADLAGSLAEYDPVLFRAAGRADDDGELTRDISEYAHDLYQSSLSKQAIGFIASGERSDLQAVDCEATLGVAIDPLDGSSNIATNLSIGTLFSLLEISAGELFHVAPGNRIRAAGFLCFGPQTRLLLTCGEGVQSYLYEARSRRYRLLETTVAIPPGRYEFAINMSNYRFWEADVRHFIDDCIAGEDGYFGHDFNMRWNASLVAEAVRILRRGGLFLYPGDARPGYAHGRLRLLYEALPLAMVLEQSGGQACDGSRRILDVALDSLDQRVPLIAGSADRVLEVLEYINGEALESNRFPLFDQRSLFRT